MTREDVLNFNIETMDKMHGPCLENPITIQEKLMWLNVYDIPWSEKYNKPLKSICADKLLVKEYTREKLGIDICPLTLGIYKTFDEIDFSKLPQKFVLKTNHNCGGNIICTNKNELSIVKAKEQMTQWLSVDFTFWCGFESHYHWIDRLIIAEELLENEVQKASLSDYKFWCFNGKPRILQIMNGRFTNAFHCNYYDMDGLKLDLPRADIETGDYVDPMPKNFSLMKEDAQKLSEDFKFVRVDFYEVNGKVYLGELTFTPAGCGFEFKRKEDNITIGNLLKI